MKIVLSVLWLACNAIIVEKGQSAILVCIDQEKQAEIRKETTGSWFMFRVSKVVLWYETVVQELSISDHFLIHKTKVTFLSGNFVELFSRER